MSKGRSGRVVIEIDPALKRRMYAVLSEQDLTLKDWFTRSVEALIAEHEQPSLLPQLPKTPRGSKNA
jgi:hypothetical protein